MPIASYSDYKAAANSKLRPWFKSFVSPTSGCWGSHMTAAAHDTMATPTSAVLCDSSTKGALLQDPVLGQFTNPLYLALIEFQRAQANPFSLLLVDRLAQSGGLSGTVTTEQTTNLPTPTLPAAVDKNRVMIGIQVYSALGSTTTTVTARYTNQSGTANRTTPAVATIASMAASSLLILPLQDGDTGVSSVEGVTLAASTGTAGNFGVTLFQVIGFIPYISQVGNPASVYRDAIVGGGGNLAPIRSDACLDLLSRGTAGTTTMHGALSIIEAP